MLPFLPGMKRHELIQDKPGSVGPRGGMRTKVTVATPQIADLSGSVIFIETSVLVSTHNNFICKNAYHGGGTKRTADGEKPNARDLSLPSVLSAGVDFPDVSRIFPLCLRHL